MKHMLSSKQYLCLILVLIFAFSALVAQVNPMTTKVTFNADDATLSSVLNALSRLSGTNIVLAVDQSGDKDKREEKRVTINIKDVPIETAVSLVARTTGLAYRVLAGNTFVVGTKQNVMEEVGERSNILYLNNLDAAKVAASLQNTGINIVPLEGQNAIMVYANQETFEQVSTLVQGIDTEQKQIEIRVRLIEINLTSSKKVGVDWSRLNHLTTIIAEDPVNANKTGLPFNYSDETGYLPHGDPTDLEKLPDDQYFQRINGFDDIGHFSRQLTAFDITIDWLLENNAAKLLTDTRVTALNGEEATLHIGEVIPFVVTDNEKQIQVEREQVGIILAVTPTVNKDGNITAKIAPEVSSVTDLVGGYVPRTRVRRVSSTVTVPNEHKIIVGGLLNSSITQKTSKLPLLGDLPFIGRLFQHRYEMVENTDLIMEITPRLVQMNEQSPTPKLDERLTRTLIEYEEEEEE
ncbi:MAG: secretin and TonB N-terminal domain-containing protein [Candidatus Cloacimonetes bacterium]|jgi:type IV pilus assembly protein PilQ|nr:secretin and TonB N-terminal domain-containing protein [Candidatus Cloacimonadota bacterium]MDD2422702.1 secretin and TonB N-terminal domain-containing protein [Candidatus Cloacimonadota bacterium]MDD3563446.1 secretin and TonB N-terminal domain-containing protein [Candidatus Cloacimonadota bacterium]MDD4276273.1 secretin and TonB N-terminal domain-containing protein [Candidatus Cloacimonadota bacterium]MDY0325497.1 secretin and TonB N-terminal domain-containing protein [Candidatus Cloacimon